MNNILQKGLTLTEMLVVVSIVVIFSTMVFANYGTGKESMALERAGQKLAQDLRRTQEMAMAGSFGDGVNAVGIYFDRRDTDNIYYIIYENKDGNYSYGAGDTDKETINIEAGIKICNIVNTSSTDTISISFAPPEPVTRIDDGSISVFDVSIVLAPVNDNCVLPSKSRTIKVNNVGRIEVNNP